MLNPKTEFEIFNPNLNWRRGRDSNPRYGFPYDSLANCSFRPLRHLSKIQGVAKIERNSFFQIFFSLFIIVSSFCMLD